MKIEMNGGKKIQRTTDVQNVFDDDGSWSGVVYLRCNMPCGHVCYILNGKLKMKHLIQLRRGEKKKIK